MLSKLSVLKVWKVRSSPGEEIGVRVSLRYFVWLWLPDGLTLKTLSPILYHCARKCKINITSISRREQIRDDRDVSCLVLPTPHLKPWYENCIRLASLVHWWRRCVTSRLVTQRVRAEGGDTIYFVFAPGWIWHLVSLPGTVAGSPCWKPHKASLFREEFLSSSILAGALVSVRTPCTLPVPHRPTRRAPAAVTGINLLSAFLLLRRLLYTVQRQVRCITAIFFRGWSF